MKLTAAQITEAKKCETPEEVVEKAKAHGIEMTLEEAKEALAAPAMMELDEDDLAAVSGGCGGNGPKESVPCQRQNCNGTAYYSHKQGVNFIEYHYHCSTCGYYSVFCDGSFISTHS